MMDMGKNRIGEGVQTIHLIAVCGTGMGALACMLRDLGFEVTGSDQKVYPPMSTFLEQKGIRIMNGYRAENLNYGPDLVVVGNVISRDNPEVMEVHQMGLSFCSMPQALNHFVARGKETLLVSGTHGKTTTASILAWMLHEAGQDPSFMIGGILKNFDSNYRLGNGPYFVIEGDEYDTAFFDKVPKFFHYNPQIAVTTSVEFDHADIFSDLDHVKEAFARFLSGLAESCLLLAFDGDKNIDELINACNCRIERYGKQNDSPWQLGDISVKPPWTTLAVMKNTRPFAKFKTRLFGEHNLLNALSVIAIADHLNIPAPIIGSALESFEGIKRRQEIRGQKRQITVMDDFAHHPTAVHETVRAVKSISSSGRLIAVFEPRTATSMRSVFQHEYAHSFDMADLICIRQPPQVRKIPDGQEFSSEQLVTDLKERGKEAYFFTDTDAIIDFLVGNARPADLVLIMSNGGFDNIHLRLLDSL
ncbi:UDP-N-acetylmuramate:L-alanyl-gamma-D-glutamyl-meso-diaminopimelate ligase (EC [Olavius sp. associated proteobacterium Delta 1]|nr:UDP-N-acetylmuramate:L-alanyl-gamma-D-glutamyl-meso-diaminopimelate ligase (EC [Olavius sp. associated proteobacterium Delta 1]